MQRKLILAEKPAVARDIARVLGLPTTGGGTGSFQDPHYVVTWCIGHLIELEEPAAYQASWKRWSFSGLPMLPAAFRLRPVKTSLRQWRVVCDLLRRRDFAAVINACDAGREGELIFRLCHELSGCKLPIERLWISSLTDQSITKGLAQLRPGRDYDPLADAARCRSEADWLVGMNATRAVTLKRREQQDVLCSIGRVQTPTLGLIVHRERQILSFIPRDYWEVHAHLSVAAAAAAAEGPGKKSDDPVFRAVWFAEAHRGAPPLANQTRRLGQAALADEVSTRSTRAATRGEAVVESVDAKTVREPPPLLFDLTSLQRTANRRMGLSAHRTLQVAQALYEKHKLISYPRTDSRYLTSDLFPELPKLFGAVAKDPAYARFAAPLCANPPPPPRRVFRDDRARDHHALIPTPVGLTPAKMAGLDREERALLDLIVRRFLGAFYPDAEFQQTRIVVRVGAKATDPRPGPVGMQKDEILEAAPPPPDRYEARGRVRLRAGWQEVAGFGDQTPQQKAGYNAKGAEDGEDDCEARSAAVDDREEQQSLPDLRTGQRLSGSFHPERRRTQPPPRYTEATLLSAMEYAGQHLSDEELRQQMKDVGLGTPATRASMIETLILRTYIERRGKQLHPTPLGMDLVEHLPVQSLASPELTGRWEARLARIARGEETRAAFMADIERYVCEIVDTVQRAPTPAAISLGAAPARTAYGTRPGSRRPARRKVPAKTAADGAAKRPRVRKATTRKAPAKAATAAGRNLDAALPAEATTPRRRAQSPSPKAESPTAQTRTPSRSFRAAEIQKTGANFAKGMPETTRPFRSTEAGSPSFTKRAPDPSRSGLAAEIGSVGTPVSPTLPCPRCKEGHLLVGRRGWGCSRWQAGCPLVVPFEVLGRRLSPPEMRTLVEMGTSQAMQFRPAGASTIVARLRLAPQGSPAGFVYLEPLP